MQLNLYRNSPVRLKLLLLLFSALFIPYIILCFYAHPVADDYNYTSSSPFWDSQWKLFLYWNGRYIANFFVLANPIVFHSLTGYRLVALLLLILIPLSAYFLLRAAVGNSISPLQKMLAALALSVLTLALLPSLPEGIYWYTGSVTYILGVVAAFFYAGTVAMFFRRKFIINGFTHIFLCIVLLFLAIGFNEVQMLLLLFGHLLIWLNLRKEKRFVSPWFSLLLFCILFSCIVFFSQGNNYRAGYFTGNHRFAYSLGMTILQMLRFFFSWVSFAPLLLASILFIPISHKLNKRSPLFQKLGTMHPLILLAVLIAILFLCIYPAYWSTGILGQHRTLNTACCYFIWAWFLFLHSLYARTNLAGKITPILKDHYKTALAILLSATILFSGNCGTALSDFALGKITGFDWEMNTRSALIIDAKRQGLKEVSVPQLQNKPESLFVLDLQPGCKHWINQVQANYFGLEKICLDTAHHIK